MSKTVKVKLPAYIVEVIFQSLYDKISFLEHSSEHYRQMLGEATARVRELESLNATLSAKLMDGPEDVIAQMQADGRLSPDYHPGEDMPAGGVELPPELVNPNGPWKTPIPEGHEQWVQRMCEAPEEFVASGRNNPTICHRSNMKGIDYASGRIAVFRDGAFSGNPIVRVFGDGGKHWHDYPLTPVIRAAIDKMEVVG